MTKAFGTDFISNWIYQLLNDICFLLFQYILVFVSPLDSGKWRINPYRSVFFCQVNCTNDPYCIGVIYVFFLFLLTWHSIVVFSLHREVEDFARVINLSLPDRKQEIYSSLESRLATFPIEGNGSRTKGDIIYIPFFFLLSATNV